MFSSLLVVAHTDAEDTKTRGATALEDNVDTVYRLKGDAEQSYPRTPDTDGPTTSPGPLLRCWPPSGRTSSMTSRSTPADVHERALDKHLRMVLRACVIEEKNTGQGDRPLPASADHQDFLPRFRAHSDALDPALTDEALALVRGLGPGQFSGLFAELRQQARLFG